jgi:replication factor C subunit 3/5
MFFVDRYIDMACNLTLNQKLLDSFNNENMIYKNIDEIIKKPKHECKKIINDLATGSYRYNNFQHLIVYGSINSNKENLVNYLLENIYDCENIKLQDVEYTINGYGNTKTKITIKQSKYHIVIEPNSNGFDKYLIQEIIQDYAKTKILNILRYKRLFKIVVINRIDNLSYYAQASLRRTMEKYSDICKFIFISDQLSKIIEPLRSRCILVRASLPTKTQILDVLLRISEKEKIKLRLHEYIDIINKSEYKMNTAIWLLELKKNGLEYDKSWVHLSDKIVSIILNKKIYLNGKCYTSLKKIREIFYNLFITNIPTQTTIRNIMIKLLQNIDNLELKNNVIEIISIFEMRLSSGTRQIIHFEAMIIRLIYLFNNFYNGLKYKYDLDSLEI